MFQDALYMKNHSSNCYPWLFLMKEIKNRLIVRFELVMLRLRYILLSLDNHNNDRIIPISGMKIQEEWTL